MKKFAKSFGLLVIALILGAAWVRAGVIENGKTAFAKGDFAAAVADFKTALSTNGPSAGLYYNLANAQLKAGDRPSAAVSLRRALMLDPRLSDARVSLSEIERAQGFTPVKDDWRVFLSEKVSLMVVVVIGALLFWVGVFAFLIGRLRGARFGSAIVCLFLALLGGLIAAAGALADPRISDSRTGVVIAGDAVTLLSAPADQSPAVTKLSPATAVRILGRSGDWTYCQDSSGAKGWLPSTAVEPVVPAA